MEGQLFKEAMCCKSGVSLDPHMMTGNPQFDPNVKLPLDSFGNGHDVDTPSWSDVSVQFIYGYPRHLVTS